MVCVAEIFSDAVLSELSSSTDLFSCSFVFPDEMALFDPSSYHP